MKSATEVQILDEALAPLKKVWIHLFSSQIKNKRRNKK